jgi:hypothetical protein
MSEWPEKRTTDRFDKPGYQYLTEAYNQAHTECSKSAIDMLEKLKESKLYCPCCEEILFQITVIIEKIRGKM